jgi:hypothetical protein
MGNQREIRQVLPVRRLGVAIYVRNGFAGAIESVVAKHEIGHFYTYVAAPDVDFTIPNMDFDDTPIGRSVVARFIVQSGGKMWCGYEAFCKHIATAAKYLDDAVFLVGDEEDYIDQFSIADGKLDYRRVHSGCWRSVEEFIRERFPEIEP